MMNHSNVKIFGIGLNKTGTSTLEKCFEILRFSHFGCSRELLDDVITRKDYTNVFKTVKRYDCFRDWPWPLIYKELDSMFPGSKFILTIRKDDTTWLESLKKHSQRMDPKKPHCRKLAYGYDFPDGNEKEHLEFYQKHNNEVIDYFKDRPNDLLVICWENEDSWEKLCSFVNKPVPGIALPHENKAPTKRGWFNNF